MDIQKMIKQSREMQSQLDELRLNLDGLDVTGVAGGLEIEFKGDGTAIAARVNENLAPGQLEKAIVAAINDAKAKIDLAKEDLRKKNTGGMPTPPGQPLRD